MKRICTRCDGMGWLPCPCDIANDCPCPLWECPDCEGEGE